MMCVDRLPLKQTKLAFWAVTFPWETTDYSWKDGEENSVDVQYLAFFGDGVRKFISSVV